MKCVDEVEVGKEADLLIAKDCPMQITVKPEAVILEGKSV